MRGVLVLAAVLLAAGPTSAKTPEEILKSLDPEPTMAASAGEAATVAPASFVGVWRDGEQGRALVIEPFYPDEPARAEILRAYSQARHDDKTHDWVGRFERGRDGKPARVVLGYYPKVDEMNEEIPDWARKRVEDKLRWRLELEVDEKFPFDPSLKATWFPGEVAWTETADGTPDAATVTGPGVAVKLEYRRDPQTNLAVLHAPTVDLDFADRMPFDQAEIFYLVKGDTFRVVVGLPKPLANQVGTKTRVTFRGLDGGSTTTVDLDTPQTQLRDLVAHYSHADPVTIANFADVPNRDPLFGLFIGERGDGTGPRLALSVRNGELVEISAHGASRRVRVFDNAFELALARQVDAIRDLALFFQSVQHGKVPDAAKENATRRLRMVQMAERLAADESLATEVRLAALNVYLSGDGANGLLVDKALSWIEARGATADPDALKPNRFGGLWTSYEEAVLVDGPRTPRQMQFSRAAPFATREGLNIDAGGEIGRATRLYQEKARDALFGLVVGSTFALYNLVVDETGGEALIGWFFGLDRYGNEIGLRERLLAPLGLAGAAVGPHAFSLATSPKLVRRTLARSGEAMAVPLPDVAPSGRPALPAALKARAEALKPLPSAPPRPAATPAPAPAPTTSSGGLGGPRGRDVLPTNPTLKECVLTANPARRGVRRYGNPNASYRGDPGGTKYNPAVQGAKTLDLDYSHNAQTDPDGCTAAAMERAFEKQGVTVDQTNIRREIVKRRHPGAAVGDHNLRKVGIGYDDLQPVLREAGIPHEVVPRFSANNDSIQRLRDLYDRGMESVVHVRYPDGAHHSVHLDEFVFDSAGRVTEVRVFDPAPADIRTFPAAQFAQYMREAGRHSTSPSVLAFRPQAYLRRKP
jgi:hypothetical protein